MANEQAIRNTRGSLVTTISQGKTDTTSTSLVLHGYAVAEYGQLRDQNLVHMLENFYGTSGPSNPIEGQLWFRANNELFVRTGSPGDWEPVVPPANVLGFNVIAGCGLTGGGLPTLSPAEVVLNVGAGTGITVDSPVGFITVIESEIDHDGLLGFVANEHINHSSIILTAGDGLTVSTGSPADGLTGSITFDLGVGDGLNIFTDSVGTDTTIVNIAGSPSIQTVAGIKTFNDQIQGDGTISDPSVAVAFTLGSPVDETGIFRVSSNVLGFATSGIQQLTIQADGVMRVGAGSPVGSPRYENKISADDDIPNKAYVDSLAPSGISPTENTFIGTGTITGMNIDQKYLVNIYGILPVKGQTKEDLSAIVIRSGSVLFAGTELASTGGPNQINWMDGNCPTSCSFIIDMRDDSGETAINCQVSNGVGGNVPSTFMTAMQLDDSP